MLLFNYQYLKKFIKKKIKFFFVKDFIFLQVLTGLITALSPLWSTQTGLFVYSSTFGFISGSYGFIKTGVSQVLGKELYSTSFSWFLLLEGIGMGLGPTIGGDFPSLKENLYILSLKKICFWNICLFYTTFIMNWLFRNN